MSIQAFLPCKMPSPKVAYVKLYYFIPLHRKKQLENVALAREEKFEEITSGWLTVGEKLHFSELQRAREQVCAALVEEERKFIRGQQQVNYE